MQKGIGLYIHIPFCGVKCKFCHFAVYPGLRREIPEYLAALEIEMDACESAGNRIDSIFIGGGSPSLLEAPQILRLFSAVRDRFQVDPGAEITVELNPESATPGKFEAMRKCGVNRLSFGLQASQNRLLKTIGRTHTAEQFFGAFQTARNFGYRNINVDLMFGLPGQSFADWMETLESVAALAPEHLSAYALDVEEQTAFHSSGVRPDDDLQADMYLALSDVLENRGFAHYEISNFAKPGFECRHNLKYWKNEDFAGLGVSAASFVKGVRSKNVERVPEYIAGLKNGNSVAQENVRLAEADQAGEDLMLALRLKEGAPLTYQAKNHYGRVIDKYKDLGLLQLSGNRARLTKEGWLLSNRIFSELLTPSL